MSDENKFILFNYEKKSLIEINSTLIELYKNIKKRRSIREFSDEDVPIEIIDNLIKIAVTAPSGANKQPWHYCIIKNPTLKNKIRNEAERIEMNNYNKNYSEAFLQDLKKFKTNYLKAFLEEAPVIIALFREKYRLNDNKIEKIYYSNESCGISLGFLLNAIHISGLFTVCYTMNPSRVINEILNIPENFTLFALLPIGYPKVGTSIPNIAKRDMNEIISYYF